jgi:hypothetical protein
MEGLHRCGHDDNLPPFKRKLLLVLAGRKMYPLALT